ncbi:MAG: hypothetical protein IMX02_13025 [Limnochordaceae bacterium]|nr:hypothetical protein [Limnochordaceae bacterium]
MKPKHDQHRPAADPLRGHTGSVGEGPVVLYDAGVAVLAMVAVFVGLAAVILDGGSQGGTASPVAREPGARPSPEAPRRRLPLRRPQRTGGGT